MRYASETTVPVHKSRAEIEETLKRYKASEFHSGWTPTHAIIGFRIKELFVKFTLPMPDKADKRFTHKKGRGQYASLVKRTENDTEKVYDQEVRQRWRALLLVIKAKLEAVECGISTIEQEFLAFIVMPNDQTVMEWFAQDVMAQIKGGVMPRLALPAPENAP